MTADLRVKSLGQGNSLVRDEVESTVQSRPSCITLYTPRACVCMQIKGETKALQTLAVVCSLLKHFRAVVVGVTRAEDKQYLADTVGSAGFMSVG